MAQDRMVEVRNNKTGLTTKIRETSWKNWGSAKAPNNDERHGYVLIRTFTVDAQGNEIASESAAKAKGETFKPNLDSQGQSAVAKVAADESKEAPKAAQQTASPVQPVQQPKPQGKADNLAAIPALVIKVAEALNAAGIRTYKELAAADPEAIGKVLDGMVPPMTAKRAQIPAWKKAAAEFVKAAETPAV